MFLFVKVGPRLQEDRDEFPPNNLLLALAGAGILWMGWTGFNGGDPFAANVDASLAVLNTHICAATSLLVWTCWDVLFFKKPSVIGAIQGMITGLVCITPGAGETPHQIEQTSSQPFSLLISKMKWSSWLGPRASLIFDCACLTFPLDLFLRFPNLSISNSIKYSKLMGFVGKKMGFAEF